jgi:hypothetical protein
MSRPRKKGGRPGLFLTIAILAAMLLMVWLLPAFRLQKIETSELRSLVAADVQTTSGLEIGQHLFQGLGGSLNQIIQLRYPGVESKLTAAYPVIKNVTARLHFPGQISIEITERMEVAYVAILDGCVMVDKEGVALRILTAVPDSIPVIEGVSATSLLLGQPLGVDVPSAMNSAISLMGAIIEADKDNRPEIALLPQIRKIRPIGGQNLYLTVVLPKTGEELSVKAETSSDQTEDMLWLRFALAQGVFNGRGKGVLDLTGSRKTFIPD